MSTDGSRIGLTDASRVSLTRTRLAWSSSEPVSHTVLTMYDYTTHQSSWPRSHATTGTAWQASRRRTDSGSSDGLRFVTAIRILWTALCCLVYSAISLFVQLVLFVLALVILPVLLLVGVALIGLVIHAIGFLFPPS